MKKMKTDRINVEFQCQVKRADFSNITYHVGVCNNGYQWSTFSVYSVNDLKTLRNEIDKFINELEKEAEGIKDENQS
jgi:hypothetical protein